MAWENGALDDDVLGTEFGVSQQANALGKISGKLLNSNLVRNGVDLSVRNNYNSPDLLYLAVTGKKIGIKTSSPAYDLDINGNTKTTNLIVDTQTRVGDFSFSSNTISSLTNPIILTGSGVDPKVTAQQINTSLLSVSSNTIGTLSNSNLNLSPNGTGKIKLNSNSNVTGDLHVTGNISTPNNIVLKGNIFIGDTQVDTVTVAPNLTQTLRPGSDNTYDIGSVSKKWAHFYVKEFSQVGTVNPNILSFNNGTLLFNGTAGSITAGGPNANLTLNPGSLYTQIEDVKFYKSQIINLLNTPLTFSSTGKGYLKIDGTDGIVIPAGNTATRPSTPEAGDTRWNTDTAQLESWLPSQTVTVTGTDSGSKSIIAANSLFAGQKITFDTSFNGITAGTPYYVLSINLLSISFCVSLTPNGDPVTITSTGPVSAIGTTEAQYLVSIGPITVVTTQNVNDLAVVYDLILGY